MILPMKVNALNSLHTEYANRFKVEFLQLLEQQTFAEVVFRNSTLLFEDERAPFHHTLQHCFACSFEGMALGLSRLWDERSGDENLLSIPNLVIIFESNNFLGCRSLTPGRGDRERFDLLYADPMRTRLRVLRTEAFAHNVTVGKSKDRNKSDINGLHGFGVVNGDAVAFCRATLELLFSLNDQLSMSKWRANKTMIEMTTDWHDRHVAFLKYFVARVQ